jgi:ABC-type molybdenum transport system ATPase subunit/photorepair protein PhrA
MQHCGASKTSLVGLIVGDGQDTTAEWNLAAAQRKREDIWAMRAAVYTNDKAMTQWAAALSGLQQYTLAKAIVSD